MREQKAYTILDDIGKKTGTFTAATTDVITSNAHGLKNGDMVVLTTTNTLPAGLSLLTVYYVRDAATNTFKLTLIPDVDALGTIADVTDTGIGTHTFTMHDIGKNVYSGDYQNISLSFDTDGAGDAAMTVKVVGSNEETCPDFSAAQSDTNIFEFLQCIDSESGDEVEGDAGFVVASADDHVLYEVNKNNLRWINVLMTAWTEGEVTVKAYLTNNQ